MTTDLRDLDLDGLDAAARRLARLCADILRWTDRQEAASGELATVLGEMAETAGGPECDLVVLARDLRNLADRADEIERQQADAPDPQEIAEAAFGLLSIVRPPHDEPAPRPFPGDRSPDDLQAIADGADRLAARLSRLRTSAHEYGAGRPPAIADPDLDALADRMIDLGQRLDLWAIRAWPGTTWRWFHPRRPALRLTMPPPGIEAA